jgi:hypothetical protein
MIIEEEFFKRLSARVYKENSLSDITWALCNSSDWFRDLFLKYCFDEEITGIDCFEREYSRGDSRPDFYITTMDGKEYLIEIKIGDRNDHFEQYDKTFQGAKKSFIANYKVPPINGWITKTWKEFSQHLNDNISEKNISENNIIKGYVAYLNSVINKVEVNKMNFTNLVSLIDFYNCLTEISQGITDFSLEEYRSNSAIKSYGPLGNLRYGKYFHYSNSRKKDVYFWLGIFFGIGESDEKYSGIYFVIDHYTNEGWCPKEEVQIIKELKSGKYFDDSDESEDGIWVGLKEEYDEKFCSDTDVEEQKQILREFLTEILQKLR